MSFYDRQIRQAAKMIKKFGQPVTWKQPVKVVPDSTKPWKVNAADPVPYTVNMVFVRANGFSRELYRLIKGTDIPTGAPKGLMAAVPFTPTVDDIVDRNGTILKIAAIDVVSPNGDPILWLIEFV
jgi:hypothetical protein